MGGLVGVQNNSPQKVPLWYQDYFEWKAAQTLRTKEKFLPTIPLTTQGSDFQLFSPHGTHILITKILQHTTFLKNIFCQLTKKKRYDFDSFTLEVLWLCWLLTFLIIILQSKGKEASAPD